MRLGLVGAAPGRRSLARWACAPAGWPPRRFFDPPWIGRVPLLAGRHLGPVSGEWLDVRGGWGAQADGPAGGGRGTYRGADPYGSITPGGSRSIRCMRDFTFQDADCVARCCGRQGGAQTATLSDMCYLELG